MSVKEIRLWLPCGGGKDGYISMYMFFWNWMGRSGTENGVICIHSEDRKRKILEQWWLVYI